MKQFFTRIHILIVCVFVAFSNFAAAQQSFPSKPIRLVTPYPPGGGTSVVAHLMGQKLTASWGQQVLVDNRPGGNTIIGTDAVAKSPPDGYTMILVVSTFVILPSLSPTPYDVIKDFAPVATLATSDYVLLTNPTLPVSSVKELIALAKSKPGQLAYGSTGAGGVQHLAAEMLSSMAGIKMLHIPYKGAGTLYPDLLGGRIQVTFQSVPGAMSYVKGGRLKAIAIGGDKRLPTLPQVPTFSEAGLRDFDVNTWFGVLVPSGTPNEIVNKTSNEFAKILVMEDTKEKLDGVGARPLISSPEQFAALIKNDFTKFAKVIKDGDIKGE